MDGILGDIGGAIGGLFGAGDSGGGGNFLSELLSAFDGGQNSSDNSNGAMGEFGQIAGDGAPLLMAFL